jgi:hypothetical protein
VVPLFLKSFHFWVSSVTFWKFANWVEKLNVPSESAPQELSHEWSCQYISTILNILGNSVSRPQWQKSPSVLKELMENRERTDYSRQHEQNRRTRKILAKERNKMSIQNSVNINIPKSLYHIVRVNWFQTPTHGWPPTPTQPKKVMGLGPSNVPPPQHSHPKPGEVRISLEFRIGLSLGCVPITMHQSPSPLATGQIPTKFSYHGQVAWD